MIIIFGKKLRKKVVRLRDPPLVWEFSPNNHVFCFPRKKISQSVLEFLFAKFRLESHLDVAVSVEVGVAVFMFNLEIIFEQFDMFPSIRFFSYTEVLTSPLVWMIKKEQREMHWMKRSLNCLLLFLDLRTAPASLVAKTPTRWSNWTCFLEYIQLNKLNLLFHTFFMLHFFPLDR